MVWYVYECRQQCTFFIDSSFEKSPKQNQESGDQSDESYLQSFTFPIQAAAQTLVVGREHFQLWAQCIVGRWWGFGDEVVDTVCEQLDLYLLGMDLFLGSLWDTQDKKKQQYEQHIKKKQSQEQKKEKRVDA